MNKKLSALVIAAFAVLTTAQAQQNDQRLNKAITDAQYFQKAAKSAPGFRDLLARRKKAVKAFRAIPTERLQPVTLKASPLPSNVPARVMSLFVNISISTIAVITMADSTSVSVRPTMWWQPSLATLLTATLPKQH